ncbi:hypothetical protein JCM33374_g3545 [Metschnikowia sp. JCM 33374]|nr:hypothetical protein JCM33374_g3545 [Metschnikowia sp. JCM 33374]
MSANDVLDVLNIQRDDAQQPAKKRQKVEQPSLQKGGMARELYNLLGPNTPPVSVNFGGKGKDRRQKVSPWTRMPFVPNEKRGRSATFHHWEKGSKELLEASGNDREYFFDKFLVAIDIPEMVDEATFDSIMAEIRDQALEKKQELAKQRTEKTTKENKETKTNKEKTSLDDGKSAAKNNTPIAKEPSSPVKSEKPQEGKDSQSDKQGEASIPEKGPKEATSSEKAAEVSPESSSESTNTKDITEKSPEKTESKHSAGEKPTGSTDSQKDDSNEESAEKSNPQERNDTSKDPLIDKENGSPQKDATTNTSSQELPGTSTDSESSSNILAQGHSDEESEPEWTYAETQLLFQYCKDFELKWHIINDRFPGHFGRSMEDLKEQFYRVCAKILKYKGTANPNLLESLDAFSKPAEMDRKKYLESLLKRTPAEIAEEESLVIEARRFELAAKKMLTERSNLLTLLDSPQSSQSIQQYSSSQGLTNLYNNLMILDKHQKKKMQQKSSTVPADPVPPQIPSAASSSHKRDRTFQTHLQQYLAGVLKSQGPQPKGEPNPIQQLLAKRLTTKEEEAYGLVYHANERLTPNVILRSTQKLPGLQQRQSVFKAVNNMLQELDIPTVGGTSWKPNMPTRKTMAKYDEMVKSVVALLEVKKGKDKLEAEIELIKSQRGLK